MAVKKKGDQFLTYRGKPLVRSGNMIYYGNMNDPYVIMIQIMSKKTQGDIEVTDFTMRWISERSGLKERSNKHSRINGLYHNRHGPFLRYLSFLTKACYCLNVNKS